MHLRAGYHQVERGRIRLEDVNSQQAAGVLMDLAKEVARVKARVEADSSGAATRLLLRIQQGPRDARRGLGRRAQQRHDLVQLLQHHHDPLFTWWMGMPYKQVDLALQDYAAFLRDKVAPADVIAGPGATTVAPIPPSPATKLNEVPISRSWSRCRRTRYGTSSCALWVERRPRRARRHEQSRRWTTAPVLSRLAKSAGDARFRRPQPERASRLPLHQENVRASDRADRLRARGQSAAEGRQLRDPRGRACRAGLIFDLADEMIRYTPEQLIALANKEFAWLKK